MKKLILISFLFISLVSFGQVQYPNGFTSTVNSSTSTLTSGSVFTGTSEDITQMAEARIFVFSDVASATDGLSIQQSSNGTNWDVLDTYTIPASTGKSFGVGTSAKFFRIVYTNGGTNQTVFRLEVVYHRFRTKPSSQRPQDGRTNDNDMEENLSFGMSYDPINNVWNRQTQDLYYIGQATQTALINNIIPATAGATATDLLNYKSGSVQLICPAGTYTTGQVTFEGSNDNVNFQIIPVYNQIILTGTPINAAIVLATTTSIVYTFPISMRYLRVRISTAITGASASVQAFSTFSKVAWTPPIFTSVNATATNFNANINTLTTITQLLAAAAAADATANPTAGGLRDFPHNFNSSTWDRNYNNYNTTTGDAGAKTTSFNGSTQTNFNARGATITVLCGTVSGTVPTLTAQMQWSPDAGTTWIAFGVPSTAITATGNTITFQIYPTNFSIAGATPAALVLGSTTSMQLNTSLPRTWRLAYVLGGTTPSFAITAVYVNYSL